MQWFAPCNEAEHKYMKKVFILFSTCDDSEQIQNGKFYEKDLGSMTSGQKIRTIDGWLGRINAASGEGYELNVLSL